MSEIGVITHGQASIIWIIGEYAERIDNADEQLEHFLETFEEESSEVQLQLLTATVKLFLKQPEDTQVRCYVAPTRGGFHGEKKKIILRGWTEIG